MFTVKKLADSLGVGPDVVRHYTALGLLEPAVNPWTGYRTYRGNDALLLGSDRSLRSLEFSLSEIQVFNAAPISGQIAQLEAREARLAAEIEALKLKADRLAKVKSFLEKARLCSGFVEAVSRPAIYSLYTLGNPRRDYAAARRIVPAWMARLPYIHLSIKVPKDELNDPDFDRPYSVELGVGVTEDYLGVSGLSVEPPVETVPAGRFLIIYLKTQDVLHLTPDELRPLREKAAALGLPFLNDSTGRLLAVEKTPEGPLLMEEGALQSAADARELAGRIGVDPEGLSSTLSAWDAAVKAGEDKAFGRKRPAQGFGGTLYAVRIEPMIQGTFGGVRTNTATEALAKDGSVLKGLYAVGECASAGLRGVNPQTANIVFGSIAGRNAARHAAAFK